MSEAPPQPDLEAVKRDLEERRLKLDERKQALAESFPQKWGAVAFGALATLAAAIVTGGFGYAQFREEQIHSAATDRTANAQRAIENDRMAVEMYFKYVDKGAETPAVQKRALLVGNLAASTGVKQYFSDLARGQITGIVRAGDHASSPGEAAAGLPDLIAPKAAYSPSDFVVYVQYAKGQDRGVEAARAALTAAGATTPAAQAIDPAKVPERSWVRYYRPEHKAVAQKVAEILQARTGLHFNVAQLNLGRPLPNGVMEVWLGKAG